MNEEIVKKKSMRDKLRKKQKEETLELNKSSKSGYYIIVACVLVVVTAFFATSSFEATEKPQPDFVPANALKVGALSTSWVCPVTQGSGQSNSLILANPDEARQSNLEINTYDSAGNSINLLKVSVEPNSYSVLEMSELKSAPNTSIFVESFSGSIAVFRSLSLSDGVEIVGCVSDLASSANFPNLTTLRNSNSLLVLSNPYDEALVIDVNANLIENVSEGSIPVLDDLNGQILPAKGSLSLNLQELFGRFEIVSIDVQSRSGFFAAEAVVSFSGAGGVNGQTITPAAKNITENVQASWVGVNPTRVVATNGSPNTHSLNFSVLAVDKRSISPEPFLVAAGATVQLENLGADFGSRTFSLSIEKGPNKPRRFYAGWLHASATAVSSGAQEGQSSKNEILTVAKGDRINIFNSSKKDAKVSYSILGSKRVFEADVKAQSYSAIGLEELNLESLAVVKVVSTQDISVSSSNISSSRFAPAVEILP